MISQNLPLRLSDVRAAAFAEIAAENPVILLSLGSHEDHGAHLPMGDFVLADELAVRIAQHARDLGVPVFVAPTMPYGAKDFFAESPGAMALAPEVFRNVLKDLMSGLIAQGLTRIVILNGHGGNVPVIHEVTFAIKQRAGIVVPSLYLWKLAAAMMQKRLGPGHEARYGHGAEPLASLNAALRGAVSVFDMAPARPPAFALGLPVSGFGTVTFQGHAVEVPTGFAELPDDAMRAAAPLASAALGEAVAAELVAYAGAFIAHFARSGAR